MAGEADGGCASCFDWCMDKAAEMWGDFDWKSLTGFTEEEWPSDDDYSYDTIVNRLARWLRKYDAAD